MSYDENASRSTERAAPAGEGPWEVVLNVAHGCFDYGGGYRSDDEKLAIFHHGIQTVINALEAAQKNGLGDTQIAALHAVGRQARTPDPAPPPLPERGEGHAFIYSRIGGSVAWATDVCAICGLLRDAEIHAVEPSSEFDSMKARKDYLLTKERENIAQAVLEELSLPDPVSELAAEVYDKSQPEIETAIRKWLADAERVRQIMRDAVKDSTHESLKACVEGEPMMHGPKPYRWCATHDDLMMRCEQRTATRGKDFGRMAQAAGESLKGEPQWWCCKAEYGQHEVGCVNAAPQGKTALVGENVAETVYLVPENPDGSLWPKQVWNKPIPAAPFEYRRVKPGDVLTVEAALAELREIFPGKFIKVYSQDGIVYDETTDDTHYTDRRAFIIVIGVMDFNGATLTEAMQAVREWANGRLEAAK